jgi:hypothetical protein
MNFEETRHRSISIILLVLGFYSLSSSFLAAFVTFTAVFLIQDFELSRKYRQKISSQFENEATASQIAAISLGLALIFTLGASPESQQDTTQAADITESQPNPNTVSLEEYRSLEQEYNQTIDDYNQLVEEYNTLHNRSQLGVYPPYVVANNRSFTVAFNYSDGEKDYYTYDSETFSAQIMTGNYMREMTVPQMEYLDLHDLADRFEGGTKYRELGSHGNYYQLEPFIVPENFGLISEHIYNKYDSDRKRVREVWNVVTQINTYSPELEETPRMPLETLLAGGGDCEDTAILAASMLEAMPADWDVQLVYMDSNNPQDPENINHALIYVDTGEYQTFMETTSNHQMNPYEEVDGYYVDVEG